MYTKCPDCDDEFLGFCLTCMDSGIIKIDEKEIKDE